MQRHGFLRAFPAKVVNGTWSDGTTADKSVTVHLTAGKGTLSAGDVPTGMIANEHYTGGSWDVTPNTAEGGIIGNVTYTYTFEEEEVVEPIVTTGDVVLTKVDSADSSTKLSNVVFELYSAADALLGTYTTDGNGQITLTGLTAGNYYWMEIRPKEGYMLDHTKHEFTVSAGQTAYMTITNTRSAVPELFSGDHHAYIIGYGDGYVHPEAYITRAEVATIFFRMLDDATRAKYMTTSNTFADVAEGTWYNVAISTLQAMGIVNGSPDGNFYPNSNISRAEFAAIAARFDENGNTTGVSFSDIYGHWAQREINIVANNGWVLGYVDGTFRPEEPIIRAEAMAMVNRVLQRIPQSEGDLLPGMITWLDNQDKSKWYYLTVQEATNSHTYGRKPNGYEYWLELRKPRDWAELEN